MGTSRITISGTVGGISINSTISNATTGTIGQDVTLPAALAGSVTSYDAGPPAEWVLDVPDNAYEAGDILDVYWAAGRRYGLEVQSVDGDAVTVQDGDAAGGDTMPAAATVITVSEQTAIDCDVVGDLISVLAAHCANKANVLFLDAAGAVLLAINLIAGAAYFWIEDSGQVNPLDGDTVASIAASQGETTAATLKVGVDFDSVL